MARGINVERKPNIVTQPSFALALLRKLIEYRIKNSQPIIKKIMIPVRMSEKEVFRLKEVAISLAPRFRKTKRKLVRIMVKGLK